MLPHKLLFSVALISSMMYMIQSGSPSDDDVFIPTHEWQRIGEDQAIPAGLHVKMDMTNGGKWAKLMDEGSNVGVKSTAIQIKDIPSTESESQKSEDNKNEKLDIKELKERMKKLKSEKITDTGNTQEKKKFRSMEEIKADLEDLQLKQESDFDVMNRVLSIATSYHETTDARLTALEDIEYYVHQVDNANDFVKINGIEKMMKLLKNKQASIREQAIHVIGTAAQGNPSVQVKAVELGVVERLMEMLKDDNQALLVRKKCLYSISCLVRHFPHAQNIFAVNGGFPLLFSFFTNDPTNKLLIKSIQLVSDMKKERLDIQSITKSDDSIEEKKNQYNRFNLTAILGANNWCGKLVSSLKYKQTDVKEASVEAMRNFLDVCRDEFNENQTIRHIKDLLRLQVAMNEWGEERQLERQFSVDNFLDADRLLQLATDGDELEEYIKQPPYVEETFKKEL